MSLFICLHVHMNMVLCVYVLRILSDVNNTILMSNNCKAGNLIYK